MGQCISCLKQNNNLHQWVFILKNGSVLVIYMSCNNNTYPCQHYGTIDSKPINMYAHHIYKLLQENNVSTIPYHFRKYKKYRVKTN